MISNFKNPTNYSPRPPTQIRFDGGLEIPGCCPEGVVYYNPPMPATYGIRIAESRYKLSSAGRSVDASSTSLRFKLAFDASATGPCKDMSLDAINFFYDSRLQGQVRLRDSERAAWDSMRWPRSVNTT